jgi:hypothetical protein
MAPSKPGPGSYGGGRGTGPGACEEGDATLAPRGNGSKGADKPPVRADNRIGWSTDQLRPTLGPGAEKEGKD